VHFDPLGEERVGRIEAAIAGGDLAELFGECGVAGLSVGRVEEPIAARIGGARIGAQRDLLVVQETVAVRVGAARVRGKSNLGPIVAAVGVKLVAAPITVTVRIDQPGPATPTIGNRRSPSGATMNVGVESARVGSAPARTSRWSATTTCPPPRRHFGNQRQRAANARHPAGSAMNQRQRLA
jgi:hypothetical protein